MKTEFHRVLFGLTSAIPQLDWTALAASVDRDDLFQSAWHFAKLARDNFLYAAFPSAWSASPVAMTSTTLMTREISLHHACLNLDGL